MICVNHPDNILLDAYEFPEMEPRIILENNIPTQIAPAQAAFVEVYVIFAHHRRSCQQRIDGAKIIIDHGMLVPSIAFFCSCKDASILLSPYQSIKSRLSPRSASLNLRKNSSVCKSYCFSKAARRKCVLRMPWSINFDSRCRADRNSGRMASGLFVLTVTRWYMLGSFKPITFLIIQYPWHIHHKKHQRPRDRWCFYYISTGCPIRTA